MANIDSLKNSEFTLNNVNAITLINFYKIFKDLIIDLNTSFNDKIGPIIDSNKDYQIIIKYCLPNYKENVNADEYISSIDISTIDSTFFTSLNNVYVYCKRTFAARSIDILYQNEDIFLNKPNVHNNSDTPTIINTMFLPDIEFSNLYYDDTSEQTKQTIWKYLQLVLFNIITSIDDISFFGDSLELLKIIDSDKFSAKIQSTVEELSKMFSFNDNKKQSDKTQNDESQNDESQNDESQNDESQNDESQNDIPDLSKMFDISGDTFNMFNNMFKDISNNFTDNRNSTHTEYNIPDKDELFSHMNNLINGKIGSLAKEIAEESAKEFDIDAENISDVNDVLKGFMKNPTKLLGLINNINAKINSKMKDGSIKESELLEEATQIFKNMKNMPGMDNFNDILKSMNMDKFMPKAGKINPNAFQNMMEQNVKMSKMKERMKKKAESNKEQASETPNYSANYNANKSENANLQDLTSNLSALMEQMQSNTSFIDDIIKKQQGNRESQQGNRESQQGNRESQQDSNRSSDDSNRKNNKKKANRKK